MQITEAEVIMPLKVRTGRGSSISDPVEGFILMCGTFVFCLGFGIFALISPYLPSFSGLKGMGFLLYPLGIVCICASFVLALMLPAFIRGLRTGSWQLRISHRGILYSYLVPVFIRWDEITALVPSASTNSPGLRIVVKDQMAVFDYSLEVHRIHGWERAYYRLMLKMSIRSARNALSVYVISQQLLPVSIDELLTAIQERFALEMNEHHISIQGR